MENKTILKKIKKFSKAVLTGGLVLGIALGSVFSFAGCGNGDSAADQSSRPSYVLPDDSTNSSGGNNDNPKPPVVSISFEDFMKDHSDKALAFAIEHVQEGLLDNKTPLSKTWGFHANEEDELDSVSLTFTYAIDDTTTRALEVANATITNPIDLDKIVDGSFAKEDTAHEVTRELAFEFDAKESYFKSDLATALSNFVCEEGAITYFSEVECDINGVRAFKIAEETANAINVYNLKVVGETDEEVVANLKYSYNYELNQFATYPLGDKESTTIITESYVQEEFAPENVNEAIKDYNASISAALDTHFLQKAGKVLFGRKHDSSLIKNITWDIGTGETISEIKMIAYYVENETDTIYGVSKITLASPIKVKELTKDTLDSVLASASESATFTSEYTFGFNSQIQGTRTELINAIFEAYGMSKECPEGAVRYYIDNGVSIDSKLESEANTFKVVEIQNDKVTEFSISIKNADSDEALIEKLKDSSNYRIAGEKSCTMEGEKISNKSQDVNTPKARAQVIEGNAESEI